MTILVVALVAAAGITAAVGISTHGNGDSKDTDTLYQVSLLQGLMLGDYDGSVTVGELKQHGAVGIGTFDGLNGELIMLDGVVYRAAVGEGDTCAVSVVADSETVPFANTAYMADDYTVKGISASSMDDVKAAFTAKVDEAGKNSFYFAVMHATFSSITVRSELAQSEPYRPLVEVLAEDQDQREWTRSDVTGTVVALYCPTYMDKVNTPGWHLHFISDDKAFGGHVLDLAVSDADATLNKLTGFVMITPDTERFQGFDLSTDQSGDIEQVEG